MEMLRFWDMTNELFTPAHIASQHHRIFHVPPLPQNPLLGAIVIKFGVGTDINLANCYSLVEESRLCR